MTFIVVSLLGCRDPKIFWSLFTKKSFSREVSFTEGEAMILRIKMVADPVLRMAKEMAPSNFLGVATTLFIDCFKMEELREVSEMVEPLQLTFRFVCSNPSAWSACDALEEVQELHKMFLPKLRKCYESLGELQGLYESLAEYPNGNAIIKDAKDSMIFLEQLYAWVNEMNRLV